MLAIWLFTAAPCNAAGTFFFQAASTKWKDANKSKFIQILCCKENWGALRPQTGENNIERCKRHVAIMLHMMKRHSAHLRSLQKKPPHCVANFQQTLCLAKASSNFHWYANLRFTQSLPGKSGVHSLLVPSIPKVMFTLFTSPTKNYHW